MTAYEKDLVFLKKLDERLREEHEATQRANISGHTWTSKYKLSRDKTFLSEREVKRVLKIVEDESRFTFTPCNTDFGFRVGFDVYSVSETAPGVPFEIELLLRFTERQLPKGWGWDQLKPHFTSAAKLKHYKFEPIRDRESYEY